MKNGERTETAADHARSVLRQEAAALAELADALDAAALDAAVDLVIRASPYLIVTGVGKSGHIGAKIASSFASTGTPSFFLHPADASHGDLGMIAPGSVLLAISNSGESRELRDTLVYAERRGAPIIAITGAPTSTLGRAAAATLILPKVAEACPNGLAPTTSTTNTLALGDALMVAVMARRGFTAEEFGERHPGGRLGLSLQRMRDWMLGRALAAPTTTLDASAVDIAQAITAGGVGCVGVVDKDGRLAGMATDGDLRRAMTPGVFDKTAADIMTAAPFTVPTDMRLSSVVSAFTSRSISNAFVVDDDGRPLGVVHIKDLMTDGYV
ncbi:MAG: KpsF/GutQ family sugar-phosphate isomerase [Pseudomonadota bacterium]